MNVALGTRSLQQEGAPLVGALGFGLDPATVSVETSAGPLGFYEALRRLIRGARRELSLASLYFGTGDAERALLEDVRHALSRSDLLRVRLILDDSRGRRRTPEGTSLDVLAPLLRDHPERVSLFLHRMPQLRGPLALLPSPLDELLAVFHLKALVADDVALLTGANLSDEYFRCRQARLLRVADARCARSLHALVATVARHSRRVKRGKLLKPALPARGLGFALRACSPRDRYARGSDTHLRLLLQHPSLALHQERAAVRGLLASSAGDLCVATAYPSFPLDYVDALSRRLAATPGSTTLLAPGPRSHSFSTGRGLKGLVPAAYAHNERAIARRLRAARADGPLELLHYERAGWVFHAKGVWLEAPDRTITLVGSSSLGGRSVTRDLDGSALLTTRDPRLRASLRQEVAALKGACTPAHDASRSPLTVRALFPLGRRFL